MGPARRMSAFCVAKIKKQFRLRNHSGRCVRKTAVSTKETIEVNGETYPVYKMEISNTSHPFYTGKMKLVDTAGRVDKFMSRYAKRYDKKGAK